MDRNRTHARRRVYGRLLRQYAAAATAQERWEWLMAAHVAGQGDVALHLHSHWKMLGLALETRDMPEAAGQLLRLALVPVGHLLGRLPAGNIGRATVSAFRPMRPPAPVRQRLAWANRPPARIQSGPGAIDSGA